MINDFVKDVTLYLYTQLNIWTILLLCLAYGCWKLRRPHPRFPPGPIGLPFIGASIQMGKEAEASVKRWSLEKYGPVLSVPMNNTHTVYLNTYEAMQQAFLKQGTKFSGRPYLFSIQQVTQHYGLLMKTYGEDFKVLRKFGNKILREFGYGKKQMEDTINKEASYFVEHLRTLTGKPVDIKTDVYNILANIICGIVFGNRFEYDDATFREILWCSERMFGDPDDAIRMLMMVFVPALRHLPYFRPANQRLIKNQRRILELIQDIIQEHKNNFDPDNVKDFIDAYLYEQQYGMGKDNQKFNDKDLEVYVRDLFLAGTETSSNTILWAILTMLHYPEHMKMIEDEIDNVIGYEGTPSMAHRESMPFTCAFLQELIRCFTIVPGGNPHCTTESAEIMGYHIPKGTMVIGNLWGINNDPDLWKNPEKFDPNRHIDENGRFVHSPKIVSFSMGPRVCLGENLARMEIFLIIVTILQNFKISRDPAPDGLPSLDEKSSMLLVSTKRYKIILEER